MILNKISIFFKIQNLFNFGGILDFRRILQKNQKFSANFTKRIKQIETFQRFLRKYQKNESFLRILRRNFT
jgi:hypothetical protein